MSERTVADIGEFGLIAELQSALPETVRTSVNLPLGIGDDAAVWSPPAGESLVVTSDSLVEGIHFRLDWTDFTSLGHKSLAVNLSDLAAMGARPELATVTLGLRGSERVLDVIALYRGLGQLAERFETKVAGGDIVASPTAMSIAITALGSTRNGRYVTRSGAIPGDLIAVSGTLGASAAGLRLLEEGAAGPRARAATRDLLVAAHLRPEPRITLGALLLESGATAAMDLSDGLFGDLPKLLAASNVHARIDLRHLPVAAALRALFPDDWLTMATRGGEDYELLFAASPEAMATIITAARALGSTITIIGHILPAATNDAQLTAIGLDGEVRPANEGAFDHFKT